ncbi:MAG TPA: zinc-binding dehydrogenase [Candidatus Nanopelagicales bacterium]|jgi:NADPH:quinone reductase-like Zn-dependent oxidoreductase|nr:zinc-binding dehydrogenase [Candidatus Nanopelagicales bacterium]
MRAASATSIDPDDPLRGLTLGEVPDPAVPPGWLRVTVRAASLNHHDLWTLRGVGITADRLPMVLGCDAAGVLADGREVVVHSVIGDPEAGRGDETLDPRRSLLSEVHQGTFADYVVVPEQNVLDKPSELSFAEAACLPTAWLTAYRMLATKSGLRTGDTVLVQGAGGGVATAAIQLASVLGFRVWATSRTEDKRDRALQLGAHQVFESGARLPERVDAVLETVGAATWAHSLKSLRPGGTVVVSGATTGSNPPADLSRVFFLQLNIVGSTMGTRSELAALLDLCVDTGLRPTIDHTYPLTEARAALERLAAGDVIGKLVLTP